MRLRSPARSRHRPVRPVRPEHLPAPAALGVRTTRDATSTRRPSRRVVFALVALVLLLAGAATAIVLTMPSIDGRATDALTADASPTLDLRVLHPSGIRAQDVDARIDGERVDIERVAVIDGGRRIQVAAPQLEDGEHDVLVVVNDVGILRTTLRSSWKVTVDTTPPAASIVTPRPAGAGDSAYVAVGVGEVTASKVAVTIGSELGTTLDVTSSATPNAKPVRSDAGQDSRRTVDLTLPEGPQLLTVVATDAAGNSTSRRLRVLVDTKGPAVVVTAPRVVTDARLGIILAGRDPHGVSLAVLLDGREVEAALAPQEATPAPFAEAVGAAEEAEVLDEETLVAVTDTDTDTEQAKDTDETEPAPVSGTWSLTLDEPAFEGRHVLEVVGTDSLGTVTRTSRTFVVDSSETLGESVGLRGGARGADVVQLQQALIGQASGTEASLAAELRTKSFGAATRTAVQQFQSARGMEADGVAGSDTISTLTLKIVIDRGANTLTLYRVGKVVKTYGVATGQAKYPTPLGDFQIQTMQRNPTWTPPDSDWAKDAKVTPPGPDNPLGTRWMAIDGTVGIHGTTDSASIGYSRSHGCIRMHIPDVEELFEIVTIGTPVSVV